MTKRLLFLDLTVKDGERALLTRNGRLERVLEPGRHRLFDPQRTLAVETVAVVRAEFPAARHAVIKAEQPELAAALFEVVETRADEIAIVSLDGRPTHFLGPWQARVYWKVATVVEVERIDTARDPDGVPPDRRSGARRLDGGRCRRLALPARPVRDPRGGGIADPG